MASCFGLVVGVGSSSMGCVDDMLVMLSLGKDIACGIYLGFGRFFSAERIDGLFSGLLEIDFLMENIICWRRFFWRS
jgi:hypothetical protein